MTKNSINYLISRFKDGTFKYHGEYSKKYSILSRSKPNVHYFIKHLKKRPNPDKTVEEYFKAINLYFYKLRAVMEKFDDIEISHGQITKIRPELGEIRQYLNYIKNKEGFEVTARLLTDLKKEQAIIRGKEFDEENFYRNVMLSYKAMAELLNQNNKKDENKFPFPEF